MTKDDFARLARERAQRLYDKWEDAQMRIDAFEAGAAWGRAQSVEAERSRIIAFLKHEGMYMCAAWIEKRLAEHGGGK